MTIDDLRKMELDESMMVSQNLSILRVVGGWIYLDYTLNTSTFVPEPKRDNKTWKKHTS